MKLLGLIILLIFCLTCPTLIIILVGGYILCKISNKIDNI